jgi:Mg-chelatase subunit ChlD
MSSLQFLKCTHHNFRRTTELAAAIAILAGTYSACSASGNTERQRAGTSSAGDAGSSGTTNAGGTGAAGSSAGGSSGSGFGGSISFDSGLSTGGADGAGAQNCGAQSLAAEQVTIDEQVTEEVTERAPADVYIMFDQSASMEAPEGNVTRWQAVTQATIAFLQSPDSAGLGVGIQFFGRQVLLEDCNASTYATPQVGIGLLPGNAQALVNAINGHSPSTETPTTAALTGAVTYARSWATQNPTHPVFVLLVTDGVPEVPVSGTLSPSCTTNIQDLPSTVAAAANGFNGSPKIPTYVLGVGPSLTNLDQIAQAGGTQQAYLISGGNVAQQVVDALNAIRGTISNTITHTVTRTETVPVACTWVMPAPQAGQDQDPSKVNVKFTTAGIESTLGMVPTEQD